MVAAWFLFVLFRLVVVWLVEQAQWGVVTDNVRIFMTGQYPQEQLFRIWLCLHLLAVLIGLTWGIWVRAHRLAAALILLFPILLAVFSRRWIAGCICWYGWGWPWWLSSWGAWAALLCAG